MSVSRTGKNSGRQDQTTKIRFLNAPIYSYPLSVRTKLAEVPQSSKKPLPVRYTMAPVYQFPFSSEVSPTEFSSLKTISQRLELLRRILLGQTPIQGNVSPSKTDGIFSKPCSIKQAVEELGGEVIELGEGASGIVNSIYLGEEGDTDSPYRFALKEIAYDQDEPIYLGIENPYRPENVEVEILKRLNQLLLNGYTPHLPIYAGDFLCRFPEEESIPRFTILEQAGGDFEAFMDRYALFGEDSQTKYGQTKTDVVRILIFQVLSVLATIQHFYPNFKHNDLHMGNVLYFESEKSRDYYRYILDGETFSVPDIGIQLALWDFDYSSIGGEIDNLKSFDYMGRGFGVYEERNHYADMFKFLIAFRSEFIPRKNPPPWAVEVEAFLSRVIPKELQENIINIPGLVGNGNLIYNFEYTTPLQALKDSYFDPLRGEKDVKYLETYSMSKPFKKHKALPIHNQALLEMGCSLYDYEGQNIPYYSYRDPTRDDPLRADCYNTRENFDRHVIAYSKDFIRSHIKTFAQNLFGRLVDSDGELVGEILTNLVFEAARELYLPSKKSLLITALLLEKAYFYVTHRHPIILENLKNYANVSASVPEIIDAYQQLTHFLISSGLEEQYLQQYQVRTLPGQS
jgi:hypothetical protein